MAPTSLFNFKSQRTSLMFTNQGTRVSSPLLSVTEDSNTRRFLYGNVNGFFLSNAEIIYFYDSVFIK